MESFFDTASQFTTLSQKAQMALRKHLLPMEVKRDTLLVRENSVCDHIFFIEKGITRTFYYKEGRDVTDWISMEGTFACSIVSFINRQPDRRGIETLEDCTLYALRYDDLEQLYARFHDVERLGRLLVSFGLIQLQQRFDDLHFTGAADRYKKIITETPTMIQRVPLRIIASYLGITQETLSRIRSQH